MDVNLRLTSEEADRLIDQLPAKFSRRLATELSRIRKYRAFEESVADITKAVEGVSDVTWRYYRLSLDAENGLVQVIEYMEHEPDDLTEWMAPDEMREYLKNNPLEKP